MSRSRVLLAVLFFAALLVPDIRRPGQLLTDLHGLYVAAATRATPTSATRPTSRRAIGVMYTGTNCTNYVAYRLVTTNGMPNVRPKSGVGNAEDWGFAMASITNSTPTAGLGRVVGQDRPPRRVRREDRVLHRDLGVGVQLERRLRLAQDHQVRLRLARRLHPLQRSHDRQQRAADHQRHRQGRRRPDCLGRRLDPQGQHVRLPVAARTAQAISGATGKTFTPDRRPARQTAVGPGHGDPPQLPDRQGDLGLGQRSRRAPSRPAQPPTITGTPRVDSTLTASTGTWSPTGATTRTNGWSTARRSPAPPVATFTPGAPT